MPRAYDATHCPAAPLSAAQVKSVIPFWSTPYFDAAAAIARVTVLRQVPSHCTVPSPALQAVWMAAGLYLQKDT